MSCLLYISKRRSIAFLDRALKTSSCWTWTGALDVDGYGVVQVHGLREMAHRVSWAIENGQIPKGMFVCHKCDNPSCCNPGHLFLGTHTDNMADRTKKGRGVNAVMPGEANPASKLTDAQVAEVRLIYARGNARHIDIAKKFGVSRASIGGIVRRERWAHIQ